MIGVGIIGASGARSWTVQSHVPAITALPDFELRAVSTSRPETAKIAEETLGVPAHGDYRDLVQRPDVDLIVAGVRVPMHYELVSAAIAAGKHVLCEWPLGNGTAEAEALATMAKAKGVRGFVGLQAQASPQIRAMQALIADGFIGTPLSVSVVGPGLGWGAMTMSTSVYTDDVANGATMLTIPVGHMLDALCFLLGEFSDVSAKAIVGRPAIPILDRPGETSPRTAWDQIAISGIVGGAVASLLYRGGRYPGAELKVEIVGTEGVLTLTGMGQIQMINPKLRGARNDGEMADLPIPEAARWVPAIVPDGTPLNVAQNYALIARDLRTGSHEAPDFDHAVKRQKLLDAITRSIEGSASGINSY